MRAFLLSLTIVTLMLSGTTHHAKADDQTCDGGQEVLTPNAPLSITINKTAPPVSDHKTVALGFNGCMRYNPNATQGAPAVGAYVGDITFMFFDKNGEFLRDTGQQLGGQSQQPVPVQTQKPTKNNGHVFGSGLPVTYDLDPAKVSNKVLMEIHVVPCRTTDPSTCDAGQRSVYLWAGSFFRRDGGPNPVNATGRDGADNVSLVPAPCARARPKYTGPAFARPLMELNDIGGPTTFISLAGCFRFNVSRVHGQPKYKYHGQGTVSALFFDTQQNVLTPLHNYTPGQHPGQPAEIFPSASAIPDGGKSLSPIVNLDAGIHSFSFQYEYKQMPHANVSPFVVLFLNTNGCASNTEASCTGDNEQFIAAVKACQTSNEPQGWISLTPGGCPSEKK